ncbi:MAG: RrF2 family transcriptional regulator [Terriglobia bacterium]
MVTARATDYAVRILSVLSNAAGKRLKVADLAAATSVPKDYVPKVMAPLVRRGWVQSYRGSGGGFALVGQGQEISLLDVVELFEGPLHLQSCTGPSGCQFSPGCPVHLVWVEAEAELHRVLAKYNIAELAARSHRQGLFVAAK